MLQAVLKQLIGNCCHGISSVAIQLPSTAPLESVSLTGCRKLRQVCISAPWLQDLAVDDCPHLNSLELQCPNLTVLSASECSSLTGFAPVLECPRLQQMNLFGCRQLQSEGELDQAPSICIGTTNRRYLWLLLQQLYSVRLHGCICLGWLVCVCVHSSGASF